MEPIGRNDELAHFVARMKLTELERQHARLQSAYEELEHVVEDAPSVGAAACALWDGLHDLKIANRPLHPDLDDISILRAMVEADINADDIGETWVKRLRREVAQGRARADVARMFGRLLEEHTAAAPEAEVAEEAERTYSAWLAKMREPPRQTAHQGVFDAFFESADHTELESVRESVEEQIADTEYFRDEMTHDFPEVLAEVCGPAELSVAQRVRDDESALRELTDAMCIMLEHVDDWRWPDHVEHVARWTRDRWRVYPQEPLSVAMFVELACGWVVDAVHHSLGRTAEARADRLARLIELNAPPIIIENERRMLAEATSLGSRDAVVFDAVVDEATSRRRRVELRDLKAQSQQGGYDYDATLVKAASLVSAEVRLQRAARPEAAVWIVKTDITDFYPSVEHDVVLDLLERFGVPSRWCDLIARFLRLPVDGEPAQRGLPMGHRTSRGLGELLLYMLDAHVHAKATVRIVRAVDDICILAADATEAQRGYTAVVEFLDACGLQINQDKTGCVAIGGDAAALADVPQGPARWGLLTLEPDGEWCVDLDAVEERVERAKQRMDETAGVLRRVEVYNDEARGLIAYLGLTMDFGMAHREHVREAVAHFVGSIGGVAADAGSAWLRWPITAGGLGLFDPFVDVLCHELSFKERALPEPPDPEGLTENEVNAHWADRYAELVRPVLPYRPTRRAPLDSLVNDFIARNRELHGSAAAGELSPYWTWTLHTYGPEIVERFGTFRFLLTELVPLKLILQR